MESSFKILLVDDQQIVLDGLKKQLNWSRFNGLICGCVSDGADFVLLPTRTVTYKTTEI